MGLFDQSGNHYSQSTADALTQALQTDPWRAEANRRKEAIQMRGGRWAPDDFQFFGIRPTATEAQKNLYLNNIDKLAAQGIASGHGSNFDTANYDIENGQVVQRKSFVDSPWGKIAVLAPAIAGGTVAGLTAGGVLGGGSAPGTGVTAAGHGVGEGLPSEAASVSGPAQSVQDLASGGGLAAALKKALPALIAGGIGLGGRALTGGGLTPSVPPAPTIPPELQQLLGTAMSRVAAQQPIVNAVNKGRLAGLPGYLQKG